MGLVCDSYAVVTGRKCLRIDDYGHIHKGQIMNWFYIRPGLCYN